MIKKKTHLETLIGSIEKMMLTAKTKGQLRSKEIFLLNLVGKIILEHSELISFKDKQRLTNMYFAIMNKYSKLICKAEIKRNYHFESYLDALNVADNCYTANEEEKIVYWQEDFTLDNNAIQIVAGNEVYVSTLPSDTYEVFEQGKDIEYSKVGKIVFLALNSETTNYIIKDSLGNDVSHSFEIALFPELHATLIISDNIYSYGTMNFKIIKQ